MAILNNLYPPIINTYMPSFLIDENLLDNKCRVYFSLSSYNNITDIKNAQVTVTYQNNNQSALKEETYPCDIMVTNIYEDNLKQSEDKYYIEIHNSDLEDGIFNINEYYKVQIRFTGINASNNPGQRIDSWLFENQSYFSEWSTICLIKGISSHTIFLNGFDETATPMIWTSEVLSVIGSLSFNNPAEIEKLKNYTITLLDKKDIVLYETKELFNNFNEFNYVIPYRLIDGEYYKVKIEYVTTNLYTNTLEYEFMIILNPLDKLDVSIVAEPDEENGIVGVTIKSLKTGFISDNITIRRASSKTNFLIWEDVYTTLVSGDEIDLTWYDFTVEAGVWYKYGVQRRGLSGGRSVITTIEEPIFIDFENIYLTDENYQLNIRFNPSISSFKYNTNEIKIETVGNKYPYFRSNGIIKYREFPLNGLITAFMDKDNLFTSREEIYGNSKELYDNYNEENGINLFYDVHYERFFREKVMDFLYDKKIKLFRSPTEGNILVKISDVNFMPQENLSRQVYSFSCILTEIEDTSVDNYHKYGIQNAGKISTEFSSQQVKHGQLSEVIPANTNVLSILAEKLNLKNTSEDFIIEVSSLDYLKLDIDQPPYLIKSNEGKLMKVNENDSLENNILPGYIVTIDGKDILIKENMTYELDNEDLKISSVVFPVDTKVELYYKATADFIKQENQLKNIKYSEKVGQLWGSFGYKDSLFQTIWDKYYINNDEYNQYIFSVTNINIEAVKDSVIKVKGAHEKYETFLIGDTENLFIENKENIITDFYISGVKFKEILQEDLVRLDVQNVFFNTGEEINNFEILNPKENGKYKFKNSNFDNEIIDILLSMNNDYYKDVLIPKIKLNNLFKIEFLKNISNHEVVYFRNKWHFLDNENNLVCDINGLVSYQCELARGSYN